MELIKRLKNRLHIGSQEITLTGSSPFLYNGVLKDENIQLEFSSTIPVSKFRKRYITHKFHILEKGSLVNVGYLELRMSQSEFVKLYAGHVGYHIYPQYRGNKYASRATRLILPYLFSEGIDPIWITCNPENNPSRKTIESVGGIFVDIVDVPTDSTFFEQGEKQKCRYRIDGENTRD